MDQAPRSLLIRQRVDAHDGRSADTLASASGDLKVVDDDTAGEEASTNAIGENLLIHHLITYSPSANQAETC